MQLSCTTAAPASEIPDTQTLLRKYRRAGMPLTPRIAAAISIAASFAIGVIVGRGAARPTSLLQAAASSSCAISDFIPLEEHFSSPTQKRTSPPTAEDQSETYIRGALENISDRISAMDRNGVSRMAISMTAPGLQALRPEFYANATEIMRGFNQDLQAVVDAAGGRFRGFCSIRMSNATAAVAELQWCSDAGFVGVLLNGHELVSGDGHVAFDFYYKTRPFWRECARLGLPVYMHPNRQPLAPTGLHESATVTAADGHVTQIAAYDGTREASERSFMRGSPWGFSLLVAQVVQELILHGLFDDFPTLQMIIGHNGEMLTYWAWRIDHRYAQIGWAPGTTNNTAVAEAQGLALRQYYPRRHSFSHYLRNNFFVTTSGTFDTAGLVHLLSIMPRERVLFAADTPYESLDQAVAWFRGISPSAVPCETLRGIAHRNAEALLGWVR